MNRTRTRTLTFRVTEEEFERLQSAANFSGASCLSDFLRQSAFQALSMGGPTAQPQDLAERVKLLEAKVSDLYRVQRA